MKKLLSALSILVLCVTFVSNDVIAQGEGNVWYTGLGAGLDFNTNPPTILEDGADLMDGATGEGAGAISNAAGVLQFYANGSTIFRADHTVMPRSTGAAIPTLNGNGTATQTGLIIPMNGFPGKYFVVSTAGGGGDVKYVVVDMNLFGGLGAVENTSLTPTGNGTLLLPSGGGFCEGALSIPEFSGANVPTGENWLIFQTMAGNSFNVVKTNGAGFTAPVVQNVGFGPAGQAARIMKTNSCFDKIANSFYNDATVEVLPFNNITGVISAPTITLQGDGGNPFLNEEVYGVEFSPNGQFLYVSESGLNGRRTVYQFDISAGTGVNPAAIIASKSFFTMNDESGGPDNDRAGTLQLGPDGRIYIPLYSTSPPSYMNVIPTPDVGWAGATPTATEFEYLKYRYSSNRVGEGLPPILRSILTQVKIIYTNACAGQATNFGFIFGGAAVSTTWDFGDPGSGAANTSLLPNPSHTYNTGGTYTVTLTIVDNCGRTHVGTTDVIIKPGPVVTVPEGCTGFDVLLEGTGANKDDYMWSLTRTCLVPLGHKIHILIMELYQLLFM